MIDSFLEKIFHLFLSFLPNADRDVGIMPPKRNGHFHKRKYLIIQVLFQMWKIPLCKVRQILTLNIFVGLEKEIKRKFPNNTWTFHKQEIYTFRSSGTHQSGDSLTILRRPGNLPGFRNLEISFYGFHS